MVFRKKMGYALTVVTVACALIFSGCATAKKPTPTPQQTAPNTVEQKNTTKGNNTNMNVEAQSIIKEADSVKGVKKSTCVVSNKTAYIGLELDTAATNTGEVEKLVRDRVKKNHPKYANIHVTTDMAQVNKLKGIYGEVGQGKPVTNFTNDLKAIERAAVNKVK